MLVKFSINEIQYNTPKGWSEVLFSKFLEYLDDIQPQRPICLDEFLSDHYKFISEIDKNLEDKERERIAVKMFQQRWNKMKHLEKEICHNFFAVDVGFWCDINPQLIKEAMNLEDLKNTFWTLQLEMNPSNSDIDETFVGFEINGVEYLLPKKHMTESTVLEFSESAQFQSQMKNVEGGDFRAMADVMVVLCKPKGEVYSYNEMKHNRRKKLFLSTTMDNVINTAFFLLKLNETLKSNLLIYTLEKEKQAMTLESFNLVMGGHL